MAVIRMILMGCVVGMMTSPVSADNSAGRPTTVFSCNLGNKKIDVGRVGNNLLYRFSAPNQRNLMIIGSKERGNLWGWRFNGPHSEFKQIRFTNNGYSYIVYSDWSAPDYNQRNSRDQSGVIVLQGKKVVSRMRCTNGDGFTGGFDPLTLPTDDEGWVDVP